MHVKARPRQRTGKLTSELARVAEERRIKEAARLSPWKLFEDRRRDRDVKRKAVLITAARFFVEEGYTRATLSDVAERLNITKPALYHYFRNKEEILFECYNIGQEMVDTALVRIKGNGADGLEKVRAYIRAYVELMCIDSGAIMVRVDDRELSPNLRSQVRSWKRAIDRSLRGFIAQGLADGSIASCDGKIAAFAIGGALNWIGHWYSADGPLRPDEIGSRYADLLTRGLATRPSKADENQRAHNRRGRENGSKKGQR